MASNTLAEMFCSGELYRLTFNLSPHLYKHWDRSWSRS